MENGDAIYVLCSHDHGVVIFHSELEAFLAKLEWIDTDANGVAGPFVYVDTGKAALLEAFRSALQIGFRKASHEPEATDPNRKYPWQQAVADAFQSSSENLLLKVNAAQRAISARLCDTTLEDLNEQIAIREALHSLSALLPETSPKQTGELESGAKDREETA